MADFTGIETSAVVALLQMGGTQEIGGDPSGIPSPKEIPLTDPVGGIHNITLESLDTLFGTAYSAAIAKDPGQYFFERVWAIPDRIELGNIVSTVSRLIEIYNAYREEDRSLTAAVANAGPGVSFSGLPSLPVLILAQSGLVFDVVVTTDGPPSIDGTLDFTLDSGSLSIDITGNRVIIFPYEPDDNIQEFLEFKTDIIPSVNGKEQRVSIRKHPRQVFQLKFQFDEDSNDRRIVNNTIFGAQAGVIGLPVWFEKRRLQSPIIINDTVVSVDTRFADFRVGSLAIVWTSPTQFDALEIQSKTDSSLTFTSGVTFAHSAGALVMPLRTTRTVENVSRLKHIVNLEEYGFQFIVIDNEADISDVSAFASHNSKVLLNDGNVVQGTIQDDVYRRLYVIDNETAPLSQLTKWLSPNISSRYQLVARTQQRVWQIRQLIHALRGSQVSFYVPTFYKDLVVLSSLASGSFEMEIGNIGFTEFIGETPPAPNNAIWIRLNNGTIVTRTITAASEIDSSTERLTVDVAWASTILTTDIQKVSLLRLSRIANDRVQFEHIRAGNARITIPTLGVQQ